MSENKEKEIEAHYGYIRSQVKRRVKNQDDAEDIIQDVCLKLLNFSGKIKTEMRMLIQCAVNSCVADFYRKLSTKGKQGGRNLVVLIDEIHESSCQVMYTKSDNTEENVVNAVWLEDNLKHEPYRDAFIRAEEGYLSRETKELFGVSEPSHKSALYRGLHGLQRKYNTYLESCEEIS